MAVSRTIYQTKIVAPRLHRVVLRERLFRLLDSHHEYPVTWVSSPAGSGKTTLIASYAKVRALPMLWYRVDETDDDEATLFYYLHQAAKQLKRGRAKPLPLFTPEYRPGVAAFTRYFFESLFQKMTPPGIIVFDNYQDVPDTSPFHEILSNGLRMLPEGIRAFVVSRKASPTPFVSLQAQSGLASVGWDAIRFTGEEIREMVEQRTKTKVSLETAHRIHAQTQGWAAAVVLTLDRDRAWSVETDRIGASSVFDYFRAEVFNVFDRHAKDFLTVTALLPSFSPGIASQLTGLDKSSELLAHLHRNNYFTEFYRDEYRFHPLFREFLLAEAEKSLTKETIRQVRCRAGKLLLDAGRTEEGMELLIAAGDWDGLVPALLAAAPGLVVEGRGRTLEAWIGSVPEEIRAGIPWLLYWLGVCRQPYDAAAGGSLIERSFELFQESGDEAGTLLAWSGAVNCAIYESKFPPLDARIEWLEKYLSTHPAFPAPEIEAAVAAGMTAALTFRQPWHPDLRAWAERSVRLARSVANSFIRLQAYQYAMVCYFILGDHGRLAMLLGETEKSAMSGEAVQAVYWRYMKSMLLNSGPFHESPVPLVEEALQICAKTGIRYWVGFLIVEGAQGAMNTPDLGKTSAYLKQMEQIVQGAPPELRYGYHIIAGPYYLLAGELRRALMHVEELLRAGQELDMPFWGAARHLIATLILVEAGELQAAREQLVAFRALPETTSALLEYSRLLAEAALALKDGAPDALDFLKDAMALARRRGFVSPWECWIPSLMARVCSAALKAGIEVEYVRQIIRSRRLAPAEPAIDVDAWPWPVKVYTLGGFEVRINDEPLVFTGKVQKRPLALLKVIIALGGKDVPQDRIEDLLWPEAEGDAAHIAFKTALSRLRKLLGVEGAIEVEEGKLSLSKTFVWVDTRALDHVVEQVSRLWESRGKGTILEEAQKAAVLLGATYKGLFLKTDDEPWVHPYRDRLRRNYLRAVTKLADIFNDGGRQEMTAVLYERAIDAGFLPGEVHRRSDLVSR